MTGFPSTAQAGGAKGDSLTLNVGGIYDSPRLNPLPAIAGSVWTRDILDRVYDTVGKAMPETEQLVPYILKGIDADDDGVFEAGEYGVFQKPEGGDILNVTAYYDLNGVYFHDGEQATAGDLFFSYQLRAMNPRTVSDVKVLMDKAGRTGCNYSVSRWLFINPTVKSWEDEPVVGNANLRFAVRFGLQEPNARFYNSSLADQILYPRHVWEGVGWRTDTETGARVSPLHADFGLAIYPESDPRFGLGVPTTETTYKPFQYLNSSTPAADSAEEWEPDQDEVIGTGPFDFTVWYPLEGMIEPFWHEAWVSKNPLYFAGTDAKTSVLLDPFLASSIHLPFIERIHFISVYSASSCLSSLQAGYVDICRWNLRSQNIYVLCADWDNRIFAEPGLGFMYLGYNLRRPSVGMWHWGQPDAFDVGYHFRKAISHAIDKRSMVDGLLGGYGETGIVPVSPANRMFFNSSIAPYEYNITLARQELVLAHADAVWLAAHGGPPDASDWYSIDPVSGKVIMPGIGTSTFNVWCHEAYLQVWGVDECDYIADAARRLGVNAASRDFPPPGITPPPDSDMFVKGWNIGTEDVGYLYDLFHSSNAAPGQNYGGFDDPLMDTVLEAARREMNHTKRVDLLKWAQGIIADKLPYDTIYFPDIIEATRQDRFVGWRSVHGTVWNEWSLLDVRVPSDMRMHMRIEGFSALAAGQTAGIGIDVMDETGSPVNGTLVTLKVNPEWAGNFSFGGGSPSGRLSVTASGGRFQVNYIAPPVDRVINVTITATAKIPTMPEVSEVSRSFVISVFPAGRQFLRVKAEFLDTDVVVTSNSLRIKVDVTNTQGFPVYEAQINVAMNIYVPPQYGIRPQEGNATAMSELTFLAPHSTFFKDNETLVILTVNATAPGVIGGSSRIGFVVIKFYATCSSGERLPNDLECPAKVASNLSAIAAALTGFIVLVVLAIVVLRKRMKA